MSNLNLARSFQPQMERKDLLIVSTFATASLASKPGDVVILTSAGRSGAYSSGPTYGIQSQEILDQFTGQVKVTAAVDDVVNVVVDPTVVFRGQISVFTKTDPFTTSVSAACYDIAGAAGAQYVNAGVSSNDTARVVGLSTEEATGQPSLIGNYAKCLFQFNLNVHYLGRVS